MAGRYQREKRKLMAMMLVINIRQAMDAGKKFDQEVKFIRRYTSMNERDILEMLVEVEESNTLDDLQEPARMIRVQLGDF